MALTFQISGIWTHFLTSILKLTWKGVCQPECQGMRVAHCVLNSSLCLLTSIWDGKGSHRSALSQSRTSGRPSVVLQIQGTGNYFEVIIARSFPSFSILHNRRKGEPCPLIRTWFPLTPMGIRHLNTSGNQAVRLSLLECIHVKQSLQRRVFIWQGHFWHPLPKLAQETSALVRLVNTMQTVCMKSSSHRMPLRSPYHSF